MTVTVLGHSTPRLDVRHLAAALRSRSRPRRRRPEPLRAPTSGLAEPQRFGDLYRWPDGSWTSSG